MNSMKMMIKCTATEVVKECKVAAMNWRLLTEINHVIYKFNFIYYFNGKWTRQ